jgi:hypothetical protein
MSTMSEMTMMINQRAEPEVASKEVIITVNEKERAMSHEDLEPDGTRDAGRAWATAGGQAPPTNGAAISGTDHHPAPADAEASLLREGTDD